MDPFSTYMFIPRVNQVLYKIFILRKEGKQDRGSGLKLALPPFLLSFRILTLTAFFICLPFSKQNKVIQ